MSGDTVKGNALQFTNDNKHAYVYTGSVNVGPGTTQKILEFNTNSEYIMADLQFTIFAKNQSDNSTFILSMNDIELYYNETEDTESSGFDAPLKLIIPPFSKITVTAAITGSGNIGHGALLTGKVGMAQRVGNLDD